MIPIVSVIGWHDAGKTAFLEKLLRELKRRGVRVATIKHTRGDFDIDHRGTDTWRFTKAGSDVVVISGRDQMALVERRQEEASLEEIVSRLPVGIDLVITEGYKRAPTPKIEVVRADGNEEWIACDKDLLALISDRPISDRKVPQFTSNQAGAVADLFERHGFISSNKAEKV